ncbi:hypothetical protein [Streptomyces uncialis]|uniref:hypothetical protein n=1 Tax=Streptomyces uncialis TaxID=1048205 RepID=UPI00094036C2
MKPSTPATPGAPTGVPLPSTASGGAPPSPPGSVSAGECDLVTVSARQGLEAVDILRRGDAAGPVLHDNRCRTLGFLVPPGTADGWDVPGSACTRTFGRGVPLAALAGAVPEPPVAGTGWLLPPGQDDRVTDPAVLREALGQAARLIEAADNCC